MTENSINLDLDVLLILPPQWTPLSPYYALPILAGELNNAGHTCLLRDLNIEITGSDTSDIYMTDEILKEKGFIWSTGFSRSNVTPEPDLLITTAAHGGLNNPEVVAAKKLGITVVTYAEALAEMSKLKELITVCGVGGKGTVASMVAVLLDSARRNPYQ